MPTLLKKAFQFFIFLLTTLVFSYTTFLSVLGTIFAFQSVNFLPSFAFKPELMLWYGLGDIFLIIFYAGLLLYLRKKKTFLSQLFQVTTEKIVFNVFITLLIISAGILLVTLKPESFPLVDGNLNPFQFAFSLKSFVQISASLIGYLCVFYPFAAILFELIKPSKLSTKKLPPSQLSPLQILVFLLLAVFFNPIFIDFGTAMLALSTQRYQFESTHTVCRVKITQVTPGSPAAQAGLNTEEVIEKINDQTVSNPGEAIELIQSAEDLGYVFIITNRAAYEVLPKLDSKTGKRLIGVTLTPEYCENNPAVQPSVLQLSQHVDLTSFIDRDKTFTIGVPKDFNSYTETAYLTNSCTMFLDQSIEATVSASEAKRRAAEGTFIQVCYTDAEMPTTVPKDMLETQDHPAQITTQPLSETLYSGFRTQVFSGSHGDISEEVVFLKNPDGGYVSLKKGTNGAVVFEAMLKSFRFIK